MSLPSQKYSRIKVFYIQVPPGGGSMVALYEMVKQFDKKLIEPVILCFYKNKFSTILESIQGCKVIYLFENVAAPVPQKNNGGYGKLVDYFMVQLQALKRLLFSEKTLI